MVLLVGGPSPRFPRSTLPYASPRWRTRRLRITEAQEYHPVEPTQVTRGPQTATSPRHTALDLRLVQSIY